MCTLSLDTEAWLGLAGLQMASLWSDLFSTLTEWRQLEYGQYCSEHKARE